MPYISGKGLYEQSDELPGREPLEQRSRKQQDRADRRQGHRDHLTGQAERERKSVQRRQRRNKRAAERAQDLERALKKIDETNEETMFWRAYERFIESCTPSRDDLLQLAESDEDRAAIKAAVKDYRLLIQKVMKA